MITLLNNFKCSCGKVHTAIIDACIIENNAIQKIPQYIKEYGSVRPFILADENTYKAAGAAVCEILGEKKIAYDSFIFSGHKLHPDEHAVGSAVMHYNTNCDLVIAVGSGVINDIGKIVSNLAGVPYFIVATAPSMDGYASATSSMDRDGLKVSLPSRCANVIIGDLAILKKAPQKMLTAGLGDMLAKYISICEWRLSSVITGEYYCEEIAGIIRQAVQSCIQNAAKLLDRDETAVKAVFEGLVLGGVAMNYALCSRPASGVEHYFSHIWDMRGLAFNEKTDFHGIQCAIGTLYASKLYEYVKTIVPNRERALQYAKEFNFQEHAEKLRAFLGEGAEAMIALEAKDGKYDVENHRKRLDVIIKNWETIVKIMNQEIPSSKEIETVLHQIGCPLTIGELGMDETILPVTFSATKDIRDKYVLSRLCWDLGILDDVKELCSSL